MAVQFSKHACERLEGRFKSLLTKSEVQTVVDSIGKFGLGETAIKFKRLSSVRTLSDSDGSSSTGDVVIVVFRRSSEADMGVVTTIELRGSWQSNSARWSTVVSLI